MIKADSALSQREVCVSKINQIEGIPMGVLCYMWHALRRVVLRAFRGCLSLEILMNILIIHEMFTDLWTEQFSKLSIMSSVTDCITDILADSI